MADQSRPRQPPRAAKTTPEKKTVTMAPTVINGDAPQPTKSSTLPKQRTQPSSSSDRMSKSLTSEEKEKHPVYQGVFFTNIRSPRRQYFTIHPEWASESLTTRRMNQQAADTCRSSSSGKTTKRDTFTINPEWMSENPALKKTARPPLTANKDSMWENRYHTFPPPPRRCQSAPPVRTRNPITWENPTVSGR